MVMVKWLWWWLNGYGDAFVNANCSDSLFSSVARKLFFLIIFVPFSLSRDANYENHNDTDNDETNWNLCVGAWDVYLDQEGVSEGGGSPDQCIFGVSHHPESFSYPFLGKLGRSKLFLGRAPIIYKLFGFKTLC